MYFDPKINVKLSWIVYEMFFLPLGRTRCNAQQGAVAESHDLVSDSSPPPVYLWHLHIFLSLLEAANDAEWVGGEKPSETILQYGKLLRRVEERKSSRKCRVAFCKVCKVARTTNCRAQVPQPF